MLSSAAIRGDGVPVVRAWFRRVAINGLIAAALLPAVARADLSTGLKAIERRDFELAVRELSPLAKDGNAEAQYHLGTLYANGDGVPQNYEAAGALFQSSAARGQASAKAALDFLNAIGVLKTAATAPAAAAAMPVAPPAAAPPVAAAAPAPAAGVPPVAAGTDWRLQLATVTTEEAGQSEARRLTRRFQVPLAGISLASEKYQMPDGSTVFRVLSQALADATAREACERIRADAGSCLLVRP